MNGKLYFMDFFSNLHVGGTGNDFSIVDLQVQRDPITERPAIFASSLKGALRSHSAGKLTQNNINLFFGRDLDESKTTSQGKVSFSDAHLLFYPLRTNRCAYMLAASPAMLQDFVNQLALMNLESSDLAKVCNTLIAKANEAWEKVQSVNKPVLLFGQNVNGSLRAESKLAQYVDAQIELSALPTQPKQLLLVSDADMEMMLESLPVLAHNRLENGISKNLWYEEVVPRKSVFYTMTFTDIDDAELHDMLTNGFIQIGANATLGYGLCKFTAHQ